MSRVNALRILAPPLVLAIGTGLLIALMVTLSGPSSSRSAVGVLVTAQDGALVMGEATGLRPGTTELRTVRLTNLQGFDIKIGGIRATASEPVDAAGRSLADCLPAVALVQQPADVLTVPAHGVLEVELTVRLAATVQAECRQLRFPLTYSATTAGG